MESEALNAVCKSIFSGLRFAGDEEEEFHIPTFPTEGRRRRFSFAGPSDVHEQWLLQPSREPIAGYPVKQPIPTADYLVVLDVDKIETVARANGHDFSPVHCHGPPPDT